MASLKCPVCDAFLPEGDEVCPTDGTVIDRTRPSIDPLIGAQLGEYEIVRRIGLGGMGIVYRGRQRMIDKAVAIKVLRPELGTEQSHRLLEEARAVASIGHRGIIDVYGFGQLPDGRSYMVTELLEGQEVDQYLAQKGQLDPEEVLLIIEEVAGALQAAHDKGIIHRDLKPSNLFLIRQADGSRFIKLLDFGLAKKAAQAGGATAQTSTVVVVGTPEFMAPEQARGDSVSPRTDIYSLGVTAWVLLTGRDLFTGVSAVEIVSHHIHTQPPPPSSIVPGIPPAVDRLVMSLLEKEPAARPQTAAMVRAQAKAIRGVLMPPETQSFDPRGIATPTAPVAASTTRRVAAQPKKGLAVPALAAAGLLIVAIAAWALTRTPLEPELAPAEVPPDALPAVVPVPSPPVAAAVIAPVAAVVPEPVPVPVPVPAPVPVATPLPADVKNRPRTARQAPTSTELATRIGKLQERLVSAGSGDVDRNAQALLNRHRLRASGELDAKGRQELASALDRWEMSYLPH